jgi:hyperosmotically inducible protein
MKSLAALVCALTIFTLTDQQLAAQKQAAQASLPRLAREVRHELVMLPYYSVFDNLEFRLSGSVVMLSGQVTRPTLKKDAEYEVRRIEGVSRVVNNIEVLPLSPDDDRIRLAVYYALFNGNSPLMRYALGSVPSIHIVIKNGHVTLTGVVDNQGDKTIATHFANKVPGLFSVTNNLVVKKPSESD